MKQTNCRCLLSGPTVSANGADLAAFTHLVKRSLRLKLCEPQVVCFETRRPNWCSSDCGCLMLPVVDDGGHGRGVGAEVSVRYRRGRLFSLLENTFL